VLNGIVGMAAGQAEGFRYSPAMAQSGIVWDEATLAEFLADPRGYLRGNRMGFGGLRSEEDIAAVIAYMQVAGAP
jgi:cytochrome c2